jgi:hypothetical protein
MGAVIYRKKAISGRAWVILGLLTVALVGYTVHVQTGMGNSLTEGLVVGFLLALVTCGIAALTLYSLNRYGAVTLTTDTLRVGRDTVEVSRIDPEWVAMLAAKASPSLTQRVGTSASTIQLPGMSGTGGGGRLLGGSYGTPIGIDALPLRLTDGERVIVPTRDRTGLLAGLLEATARRG